MEGVTTCAIKGNSSKFLQDNLSENCFHIVSNITVKYLIPSLSQFILVPSFNPQEVFPLSF